MNNTFRLGLLAALLLLISTSVGAENVAAGRWRPSFEAEYWGAGNDTPPSGSGVAQQAGGAVFTLKTKKGAAGIRLGAMRDYSGLEMGPSLGYLSGGPEAGTTSTQVSGSNGQVGSVTNANTVRLLAAGRKTWMIQNELRLRIGAGLGMAVENQTTVYICTRFSCPDSGVPDYSSLGWFTWELSPSIVYENVSLGMRYVGFARGSAVPWNTFGGFFGVDF